MKFIEFSTWTNPLTKSGRKSIKTETRNITKLFAETQEDEAVLASLSAYHHVPLERYYTTDGSGISLEIVPVEKVTFNR